MSKITIEINMGTYKLVLESYRTVQKEERDICDFQNRRLDAENWTDTTWLDSVSSD